MNLIIYRSCVKLRKSPAPLILIVSRIAELKKTINLYKVKKGPFRKIN